MSVTAQKRARVRRRAQQMCEYCRLPQRASILPHQVDHIVAQQHLGTDEESNLCLCCLRCNLKKGPNVASVDPDAHPTHTLLSSYFTPANTAGKSIFSFRKTDVLSARRPKVERRYDS